MQSNFMILLCVIIPFEYGAQAEDACQEIQKLNGRPKAVFASKGFLYAQVSGNLYACSLNKKPAVWKRMDLPDLMDLRTNGSGELFARSTDPPESPFGAIPGTEGKPKQMFFHKVKGYLVQELARYSKVDTRDWYVDATGRIWFQGADLIVIPIGKEPRVIKSRPSNYGHRVQQPCEWKPGHVILFYNTSMVVGTPSQVTVHRPPRFAEDGTGSGPLRLGTELLVSGGRNNPGRGSYLMDARAPETKPIRIGLGWDWFHPVASAPDGRALVRAQTDRNPQYTLFWYAPDGQSQVRLEGAGAVLRSGLGSRVLFDDAGRGFMRLKDGTLAIFEEKRARVVTRSQGLPFERLAGIAMSGRNLILADESGRVILRDLKVPFKNVKPVELKSRGEWRLAGPCCVDGAGDFWAFLADFPGMLSRFDGDQWHHRKIELGKRRPLHLTADNVGQLQVGFYSHPAGSMLVTENKIESWKEKPSQAWEESVRRGALRFFDGSNRRAEHWTNGNGRIWFYNGRILLDGFSSVDYYDTPSYSIWWADPDNSWFRFGSKQMVYRKGRWRRLPDSTVKLLLGPNGLRSYDQHTYESNPDRFVLASYDRGRGFAAYGRRHPGTIGSKAPAVSRLRLKGREVYLPVAAGGGWVGTSRFLKGAFVPLQISSEFYESAHGRFFRDRRKRTVKLHKPRDLKLEANLSVDDNGFRIQCRILNAPPPQKPQFVVRVNGVAGSIEKSNEFRFPKESSGAEIEIWAVDEFGDSSTVPATVLLKPEDSVAAVKKVNPQWNVLSGQVKVYQQTYELGDSMAIAGDGTVFVTAKKDQRSPAVILQYREETDKWSMLPRTASLLQPMLMSDPGGKVWTIGRAADLERPLYEVNRNGLRLATMLYTDTRHQRLPLIWDSKGRLWWRGLRWLGRWGGDDWQEWEVPGNYSLRIVASPTGRISFLTSGRFWTFMDGKMGDVRSLPDGWLIRPIGYPLGDRYLVTKCESRGPRKRTRWGLYDFQKETLNTEALHWNAVLRPDGKGNLFVWNNRTKSLQRLMAGDLSRVDLPYTQQPSGYGTLGKKDFLVTSDGSMFYAYGKTKLILWKETQGPQMWGWQTGIASDYTHAIEEAADGKVWILRQTQLLVYDPKGDPVANSAKFDGWEEMPILGIACRGFEGSVWYMEKNSGKVVRFDGTARKTWLIPGEPERRYAVIEVVSDRNEAVVRDSRGRYFLLQQNGAVIKTRGRKEGVLQMAVAGAKEFKASGPAPVVTAGGRLYFDGEIRSGKQWIKTQKGSGILDLRGELLVMANENSPRPYVYRFNGNKAEEIGTADRYLLDSHGLRWYDPGIIEDNPKRFPVLFIEKRGEKVALSPDSPKHGPLYGARKAIRVGVESFVVMQKYGGMFFLSPEGLKKIDVTRIPFGSEEALLHPLGNQRYAWLLRSRIFISPTEFQLVND